MNVADEIKHAMYYGAILGLVFILNFCITISGIAWLSFLQLGIYVLVPYLLYLFMRKFRDEVRDGHVGYFAAINYSVQLFFYASLLSSFVKYVYFKFVNKNFLSDLFEQSKQLMVQLNMPVTDQILDATRVLMTPSNMVLQYLWMDVFLGVMLALVVALFVKR